MDNLTKIIFIVAMLVIATVAMIVMVIRSLKSKNESSIEKYTREKKKAEDAKWGSLIGFLITLGVPAAKYIIEWWDAPKGSWQHLAVQLAIAVAGAIIIWAIIKLIDSKINGSPVQAVNIHDYNHIPTATDSSSEFDYQTHSTGNAFSDYEESEEEEYGYFWDVDVEDEDEEEEEEKMDAAREYREFVNEIRKGFGKGPHVSIFAMFLALVFIASSAFAGPVKYTPGNKWEYRQVRLMSMDLLYKGKSVRQSSVVVEGKSVHEVVKKLDGENTYLYRETVTDDTKSSPDQSTIVDVVLQNTEDASLMLERRTSFSHKDKTYENVYEPPIVFFHKNDKTWDMGDMVADNIHQPTVCRVAGKEDITVPAGEFAGCTKLVFRTDKVWGETEFSGRMVDLASGQAVWFVWFRDDVGIVRELAVNNMVLSNKDMDDETRQVELTGVTVTELMPGYISKD